MRIQTRNELAYADSLVMTNPTIAYPVENIYALFKETIAQASATSTTITASWNTSIIVDSFFIGYHNISSITIRLYDSLSTLLHTEILNNINQDDCVYLNAAVSNVASCIIDLVGAENIFLGSLSMGQYYEVYNVVAGYEVEYLDTSNFEQSTGGQTAQFSGTILRSFELVLAKLTATQRALFIAAYKNVLKGKSFWLDQYPDISNEIEPPWYGFFSQNIIENRSNSNGFYNITTAFTESK